MNDGLAYSLMVGLGESYLTAYALARGFSEFSASLISTLPLLAGAVFQLFAPLGILWLKSYRRWVILVATGQALCLWLLAGTTLLAFPSYILIFTFIALYWAAGMAVGPAWNSWLAELIPTRVRTAFFARRSQWCHAFTFIGLISGGIVLQFTHSASRAISNFTILFLLAGFARLISVYFLSRHSSTDIHTSDTQTVSFKKMVRIFTESPLKRLLIFLLLFQTAINFSAGLFSPYMLAELRLDYTHYMILLASSLAMRFVTLQFAKPILAHIPLRRMFFLSLTVCALVPIFWTQTTRFADLIVLQVVAGFGWGFYELIAFLILFNELPMRDRTTVLTFYNLLQTTGIVIGAVCGGFFFKYLGQTTSSYYFVFETSTYLRLLALLALPGFPLARIHIRNWVELRPFSVRAHGGLFSRPIIVRLPMPKTRPIRKTSHKMVSNENSNPKTR